MARKPKYQTRSDEAKERQAILHRLKRLHKTTDGLRCDPYIQKEALDTRFDDMLLLIDEVFERLPEVTRIYEEAA